ncbi:MAG: hypothetical protein HUU01_12155 [Saprospiraceae bacterium]|nr:hypothetical protein [Saprospiraceae bacterium]
MIKTILKLLGAGLVVALLTVLTQVGGVVYLLSTLTYRIVFPKPRQFWVQLSLRSGYFGCSMF